MTQRSAPETAGRLAPHWASSWAGRSQQLQSAEGTERQKLLLESKDTSKMTEDFSGWPETCSVARLTMNSE